MYVYTHAEIIWIRYFMRPSGRMMIMLIQPNTTREQSQKPLERDGKFYFTVTYINLYIYTFGYIIVISILQTLLAKFFNSTLLFGYQEIFHDIMKIFIQHSRCFFFSTLVIGCSAPKYIKGI